MMEGRLHTRVGPSLYSCALLLLGLSWQGAAFATTRPLRGLLLTDAIAQLTAEGLPVVYSSDVVRPALRVESEPQSYLPRAMLEEMLVPHGLMLREMASGRLVIVRKPEPGRDAVAPGRMPRPVFVARAIDVPPLEPPASEIVVTGSRYQLQRLHEIGEVRLTAVDIERMPDLGDDPMRAVARLPGAATGGFSARSSIRGGELDETLVRFDGLRLHNPFHLKDFQGVFSTIDPALVRSVEVYTGGYPVGFGDRMSGVIDIETLAAPPDRVTTMSLSLFNAGVLAGDRFNEERSDWLVSARRGNLDLLVDAIDPGRGKPRYFDLHARLGHRLSDRLMLRASLLHFEDDITISDGDQEENAEARYEDSYYWLSLDWRPSDTLSGRSHLGHADLRSERSGSTEQPGISSGELHDRRDSRIQRLETRWLWLPRPELQVDFGAEYRRARGDFRYEDAVDFDLLIDMPGAPDSAQRHRDLSVHADGDQLAAFVSAATRLGERITVDAGLRYDRGTLTQDVDEQWSPRLGLAWELRDDLGLSAAWGRFAQSQSVEELQIADGVTEYRPAQSADHLLLGLRYRPGATLEWRLDAYEKRYEDLRPRFENLLNSAILLPELKPDRIRIDAQRAVAQGVELSLQSRDAAPLGWWVNYSWSRVRDRVDGASVLRSWDQTHAVGAGVGWNDERWDLDAAVAWHSGWPTTALELTAEQPIPIATPGARNALRLGSFASLDLRAARRFAFDGSLLTVFVEVSNATNRKNECCVEYEYNTEETTPFLELDSAHYLPVVPNLGFTWEF